MQYWRGDRSIHLRYKQVSKRRRYSRNHDKRRPRHGELTGGVGIPAWQAYERRSWRDATAMRRGSNDADAARNVETR